MLGLGAMPDELTEHLKGLSSSEKSQSSATDKAFSTIREDSEATAYKWKLEIDFNLTKTIDSQCEEMYKMAGYEPVLDEPSLRNMSHYHKIENFLLA